MELKKGQVWRRKKDGVEVVLLKREGWGTHSHVTFRGRRGIAYASLANWHKRYEFVSEGEEA